MNAAVVLGEWEEEGLDERDPPPTCSPDPSSFPNPEEAVTVGDLESGTDCEILAFVLVGVGEARAGEEETVLEAVNAAAPPGVPVFVPRKLREKELLKESWVGVLVGVRKDDSLPPPTLSHSGVFVGNKKVVGEGERETDAE